VMMYTLATRRHETVSVLHDRNPVFVRLSDGAVRNAYTIRILNKNLETQSFILKISGLAEADVAVIGNDARRGSDPVIDVGPDQSREVRVLVTTHQALDPDASIPLTFTIIPDGGGASTSAADHFLGP
jgi:polyferredoxin